MEIELSQRQIDAIAYRMAVILFDKMKKYETERHPEMVSTREAAEILRITPKRMREIADRYPHVKDGDSNNSRLRFYRKSLTQE